MPLCPPSGINTDRWLWRIGVRLATFPTWDPAPAAQPRLEGRAADSVPVRVPIRAPHVVVAQLAEPVTSASTASCLGERVLRGKLSLAPVHQWALAGGSQLARTDWDRPASKYPDINRGSVERTEVAARLTLRATPDRAVSQVLPYLVGVRIWDRSELNHLQVAPSA